MKTEHTSIGGGDNITFDLKPIAVGSCARGRECFGPKRQTNERRVKLQLEVQIRDPVCSVILPAAISV